jgi:hypothetical protein
MWFDDEVCNFTMFSTAISSIDLQKYSITIALMSHQQRQRVISNIHSSVHVRIVPLLAVRTTSENLLTVKTPIFVHDNPSMILVQHVKSKCINDYS